MVMSAKGPLQRNLRIYALHQLGTLYLFNELRNEAHEGCTEYQSQQNKRNNEQRKGAELNPKVAVTDTKPGRAQGGDHVGNW